MPGESALVPGEILRGGYQMAELTFLVLIESIYHRFLSLVPPLSLCLDQRGASVFFVCFDGRYSE